MEGLIERAAALQAELPRLTAAVPNFAAMIAVEGEVLVAHNADVELCACSTAKVADATAVMSLVQDGLIDLDAPVASLDPRLAFRDPERGSAITLRMLLSHTSGLDDTERVESSPLACLPQLRHIADPGRTFRYANVPFSCGLEAAARRAGMTGEQLVETRVLNPLGMTATRWRGQFGPHQGTFMATTVRDLTRLADELLGGGKVLTPSALAEMTRIHGDSCAASGERYYGLGVDVERWDGLTLHSHGGGLHPFGSGFVVDPATKASFAAMFDHPAGYGVSGVKAFDRLFGRTTRPPAPRALAVDWRDYLGTYANGAEISEVDGHPRLRYGSADALPLVPYDTHVMMTAEPVTFPGMSPRPISVGLLPGEPVMITVNTFPPIGARPGRRL